MISSNNSNHNSVQKVKEHRSKQKKRPKPHQSFKKTQGGSNSALIVSVR